jgi:hypothetical protein
VFPRLRTNGFSFDVELLARLRAVGASVAEFAVAWTDVPGSTFTPARHGAASFLELARISWSVRAARSGAVVRRLPVVTPVALGSAVDL